MTLRSSRRRVLALCLGLLLSPLAVAQVRVPGYARFRGTTDDAARMGRLLIDELGCHACHESPDDGLVPPRQAPVLTEVSRRVDPDYLRDFLKNPSAVRPGTRMPHLARGNDATPDADAARALAAFLTNGSTFRHTAISHGGIESGRQLFGTLGCTACHGPPDATADTRPEWAVPLERLDRKYSAASLAEFLTEPHQVRPSGRMPSLNLSAEEARDIAAWLLRELDESLVQASLEYEVFEGSWESLPDFESLTPVDTGVAPDFGVSVTDRDELFALRFRGYLQIPRDGEYRFRLASDDGSRLLIDGDEVIRHDGVHPASEKSATRTLTQGAYPLVLEYFEFHGEESLALEVEGPGLPRQSAAAIMSRTETPPPQQAPPEVDDALVAEGRALFTRLGCAACHEYSPDGTRLTWTGSAPALEDCNPEAGCLNAQVPAGIPQFGLTPEQRSDIRAALRQTGSGHSPESPESRIRLALMTLNCYACHQRDKTGGVPPELETAFQGRIPEMGDEGRIPPALDGVGDKLKPDWLRHVLANGAKDRPYLLTRMPKFGNANTARLAALLSEIDVGPPVAAVEFDEPDYRVKAEARLMIGDKALSCIKCHSFDTYEATGLQAMNLTTMHRRLRRDWFHRYLLDPQAYRPGTRMPAAWPNGRSVVPHILDKSPAVQIEAIWRYLEDGASARVPSGLIAEAIELIPDDRPILYRNFIAGLSPRGIAVGFPERAHFAWDAEHLTARLIWHNAFIDASRHWIGRGPGTQGPLGDHVIALPDGPPLARLESPDAPWPGPDTMDDAFHFLGYRLDADGVPTFRYRWQDVEVTDTLRPVVLGDDEDAAFERIITVSGPAHSEPILFRVAEGPLAAVGDAWLTGNAVRFEAFSVKPVARGDGDDAELLVPLPTPGVEATRVRYRIRW